MTWRYVVYDIWTSLKQTFDDADVSLSQVKYWCSIAASRLLMQHIEKRDSGAFLTVYTNIQVLIDTETGYKYFDLPADIMDFTRDGGVHYLSYSSCVDDCTPTFTSVTFTRTSPAQSHILYYTDEEKPRPSNPYWYRVGERIYLLGLECIDPCGLEIGVYQNIDPTTCDLDDEFPFPDELLAILQRYVLDIGRFVLAIPHTIGVNDGAADIEKMPTSKLISTAQGNAMSPEQQQQQQGVQQQIQQRV